MKRQALLGEFIKRENRKWVRRKGVGDQRGEWSRHCQPRQPDLPFPSSSSPPGPAEPVALEKGASYKPDTLIFVGDVLRASCPVGAP